MINALVHDPTQLNVWVNFWRQLWSLCFYTLLKSRYFSISLAFCEYIHNICMLACLDILLWDVDYSFIDILSATWLIVIIIFCEKLSFIVTWMGNLNSSLSLSRCAILDLEWVISNLTCILLWNKYNVNWLTKMSVIMN